MISNDNTAREEQEEVGSISLEILHDSDCESPREWDNLGTMVCAHRRYSFGDSDGFGKAVDVVREHYSESHLDDYDLTSQSDVYELMQGIEQVILLPLYLYDHGSVTMRTTPFSCRWDSSQVGYVFVTKQKIRSEYGWKNVTRKRVEKVQEYLRGEVEVYDQFIRGDVYYFLAKKDGDVVDSCGGFYGRDPTKNGMIEHLSEPYLTLARELKATFIDG